MTRRRPAVKAKENRACKVNRRHLWRHDYVGGEVPGVRGIRVEGDYLESRRDILIFTFMFTLDQRPDEIPKFCTLYMKRPCLKYSIV